MTFAPLVWTTTMADYSKLLHVRAADGGARLFLSVETSLAGEVQKQTLCVFASHLDRVPCVGPIDGETLAHLRREHALCAALDTGLRSLSAGGGSRVQLTQKLCARGVARELADEAADELSARGYLQERENALAAAARDLRKLWGDRRILADLRAKGYGDEALCAVREYLAQQDGTARCVRLLEKKRIRTLDAQDADKLIASLMRYGYTRTEIREALRRSVEG